MVLSGTGSYAGISRIFVLGWEPDGGYSGCWPGLRCDSRHLTLSHSIHDSRHLTLHIPLRGRRSALLLPKPFRIFPNLSGVSMSDQSRVPLPWESDAGTPFN